LACQPYGGSSTHIKDYGLGQGPNVVIGLSEQYGLLPGTRLYVDNLFTSLDLLDNMGDRRYGVTGTLRQNRIIGIPLENKKLAAKEMKRGDAKAVYTQDSTVVVWKDNQVGNENVSLLVRGVPIIITQRGQMFVDDNNDLFVLSACLHGQQLRLHGAHGRVPEVQCQGPLLHALPPAVHERAVQQVHGGSGSRGQYREELCHHHPCQEMVLVPVHVVSQHLHGAGLEIVQVCKN
jgi:hypothetical protein